MAAPDDEDVVARIASSTQVRYPLRADNVAPTCKALLSSKTVTEVTWGLTESLTDQQLAESVKPMLLQNNTIEVLILGVYRDASITCSLVPIFQGLENNTKLKHLQVMSLCCTRHDAFALWRSLRNNANLTNITLINLKMGDRVCFYLSKAIESCTALESLHLINCKVTPDNLAVLLSGLPRSSLKNLEIHSLDVTSSRVSTDSALCIEDSLALSSLKKLEIYVCDPPTTREVFVPFMNGVQRNSSLEELELEGTPLDDHHVEKMALAIRNHKSLVRFFIEECGQALSGHCLLELAKGIGENDILEEVEISISGVCSRGFAALLSSLATSKKSKLRKLTVNEEEDFTENADALSVHVIEESLRSTMLQHLCLVECELAGSETLDAILRGLSHSQSIHTVKLERNGLQANDAGKIADMLRRNKSIQVLDLSCNRIGNIGAGAVASAVSEHPAMKSLNLRENEITDLGNLTSAFSISTMLQSLDLSCNDFGDDGAQLLSEALVENVALTSLEAAECGIIDRGAVAIGQLLKRNTTLQTINLRNNEFSQVGRRALADALESTYTLTKFSLGDDAEEQTEIDFYCNLNKSGRKHFLQDEIVDQLWAYVLYKMGKDGGAAHLFYTLLSNPGLMTRRRSKRVLPQVNEESRKRHRSDIE